MNLRDMLRAAMKEKPEPCEACPTCAQRVTVHAGSDGAISYTPWAENNLRTCRKIVDLVLNDFGMVIETLQLLEAENARLRAEQDNSR